MEELFGAIFEAIYNFFVPDRKLTTDIGRLLGSGQYEQCAAYIKSANKKKLKREFKYIIAHARKPGDTRAMHRYKMVNELYELVFKEKCKYYKDEFYKKCVEAEQNEYDKPLDGYIVALQPYFN